MIDYLSRPKMTERQKHRKIRRQKEEKAEKFERLNCISANSNDISISLNHIFLLMRPMKSFLSLQCIVAWSLSDSISCSKVQSSIGHFVWCFDKIDKWNWTKMNLYETKMTKRLDWWRWFTFNGDSKMNCNKCSHQLNYIWRSNIKYTSQQIE